MADTLDIRLAGSIGGRPISASDLDFSEIKLLVNHLEQAVTIEAGIDMVIARREGRERGKPRPLNPVRLALADVSADGGVVYHFLVGSLASDAVSRITAGLAGSLDQPLLPEAAQKVRAGINRTITKGLSVQLVNGVTTPMFSKSEKPPELPIHPTRKFESEILVKILRVGGKRPLARVKLLTNGQEATLRLSGEKAAREIGHHLYRDAVVKGDGDWVIDENRFSAPSRLVSFKVTNYRFLAPASMRTVIDEMTDATNGIWDNVDPTNRNLIESTPGAAGDLHRQ